MKRFKRMQGLSSEWELYTFSDKIREERELKFARDYGIVRDTRSGRPRKHRISKLTEYVDSFIESRGESKILCFLSDQPL